MPKPFTLADQFKNPSMEKELLSAIIARPDLYWETYDLLNPDMFFNHREQFQQIARAIEQEKPIPEMAEIQAKPCSDPMVLARNLADIYQKALLASLIEDSSQTLLGKNGKTATEIIAHIETTLLDIQQAIRDLRASEVRSLSDLLPDSIRDINERKQAIKETGRACVGLPTGMGNLDRSLGGLQTGIHLLGAQPGQGKTTLALQIAVNIARKNIPVLFVSFEESLIRLTQKVICHCAGLNSKKFIDGYGDPREYENNALSFGKGLSTLYLVEGTSKLTIPCVKAKALQIMTRRNSKQCLIIIDYLQKWAGTYNNPALKNRDFRHVVSFMASELREVSHRLNSPILIISSQSRVGQGTSNLTSLKESGDLEYSADTAMFLVDSNESRMNVSGRRVDLVISKNRFGDQANIKLIFKPEIGRFGEVER